MAGCSGDPDHTRASPDTKPGESLSPCLMRGGTTGTAEGWCLQVAPPPLRPCGGLAGPCPTQSQCLAAAAGTRPQGPLSANETLCSGRAPGPPHGGHTGEGLAELCTPLAIGHTRPESQRPQWDPAVVGQAEPQAKSTRHQPRQNRPGGKRKKRLLPLKDGQGGKPGCRGLSSVQELRCVVSQQGSENPQRSTGRARRGSGQGALTLFQR